MGDERITLAELERLFGPDIPIAAVSYLLTELDGRDLADIRADLGKMASDLRPPVANPPAPDVTFWVIERVKYLSGLGWKPGPVYVRAITDERVHDYTQDFSTAKQFPTKEVAATFLKDALANNEAFAVVEHAWIKRNPPAPDVEAIVEVLWTKIKNNLRVIDGHPSILWNIRDDIEAALTAHTASLREKVEELEREHSILSLALKEAGDRNVTLIAERTEAEADANRMREALTIVRPILTSLIVDEHNVETWGLRGRLIKLDAALSPRPADEPVTQGER